ncbi:MAG: hypothetical protein ACAH17_03945 [Candidatus Paceibacterota bacterium]
MKKILLTLSFACCTALGLATASAQYYPSYDYGSYSYDTSYTTTGYANTSYSSYYPQTYYGGIYGKNSSTYNGGIGSYTIGCTTYYYNTRTGAQLYTSYICSTYQPQPTTYTYSTTYPSYPSYTYPTSQYYTYGYSNGSWYPGYQSSIFDSSYNNGYQNYLNCYHDMYGQYVCY